ncbi:MAG: SWIM zinc finger family protein [Stellaceae bacterium]
MARSDDRWTPYVPVAERRRQAARMAARLRKKGQVLAPVTIAGRTIAATFWGKAWCDNLEAYSDYETRLPRGRTYVRNGAVIDLQIARGQVTALVSGSEVYRVALIIKEMPAARWRSICTDCAGSVASVVELLQGRFAKGVMERLCRQDGGLFPWPCDIRFSCSCPDHALLCKHVAAVLYGVGARLDDRPELLFRLRGVDEGELIAHADMPLALTKKDPAPDRVLQADDISALFGLDMAEPAAEPAPDPGLKSEAGPGSKLRAGKAEPLRARRGAPAPQRVPAAAVAPGKPPSKSGGGGKRQRPSRGPKRKGANRATRVVPGRTS